MNLQDLFLIKLLHLMLYSDECSQITEGRAKLPIPSFADIIKSTVESHQVFFCPMCNYQYTYIYIHTHTHTCTYNTHTRIYIYILYICIYMIQMLLFCDSVSAVLCLHLFLRSLSCMFQKQVVLISGETGCGKTTQVTECSCLYLLPAFFPKAEWDENLHV